MENKNIFIKRFNSDDPKEKYYKLIEIRQKSILNDNITMSEYIKYLQYILEENKIKYYRYDLQ